MRKINYNTYYDKLLGCWLGKCIGGACGAASENNKDALSYTEDDIFPEVIPPNDDLDLQVLYLCDVLEKKGVHITSRDLALSFAEKNMCLANEYGIAIKNICLGVMPPESGVYDNGYFKSSMGCPIRSELWACLMTGSPDNIKKYCTYDGCIDHGAQSINAQIFWAVLESEAFFEADIIKLAYCALSHIPPSVRIHSCLTDMLRLYESGTCYGDARAYLVKKFGSQDASSSTVNGGLTLLALLYGGGDFSKTLLYAVNGGYDTDCNAATALSVLGIISGAEGIPRVWLDRIGNELVVGTVALDCPYKTIEAFADGVMRGALSFCAAGLSGVLLDNIPEDKTPSLPDIPAPDIEMTLSYAGGCVIAPNERKTVALVIENRTKKPVCDTLCIECAPGLVCDTARIPVTVDAHSSCVLTLGFRLREDARVLPRKNICKARLGKYSCEFGIVGAMRMKLYGPFCDSYDTEKFSENPLGMRPRVFDLRTMFGGFADIAREYTDETFENVSADCLADISGCEFDIDKYIGYAGKCCVYLVHDFICEKPVRGELHIGSTAPHRITINKTAVSESREYLSYSPFNVNVPFSFEAGKNRVVYKLTRTDSFRFSAIYRNALDCARFYDEFITLL